MENKMKNFIDDIWQYEVIKNEGEGLQGYGWKVRLFKNGVQVHNIGNFGAISIAEVYARDYFLLHAFNIERPEVY
jgi:hypothetical protein